MANLTDLRKEAGLTQEHLGLLLDVARATIIRWEGGTTEPNATQIRRLAWALRTEEAIILDAVTNTRRNGRVRT